MSYIPKLAVALQPLGDRVAVVPLEAEQVTASGIVIPDTAKGEKPQQGVVIALGQGKILSEGREVSNPADFLEIGDKVLFGKYAGDEVKLKDDSGKDVTVKVLSLPQILGIVS